MVIGVAMIKDKVTLITNRNSMCNKKILEITIYAANLVHTFHINCIHTQGIKHQISCFSWLNATRNVSREKSYISNTFIVEHRMQSCFAFEILPI